MLQLYKNIQKRRIELNMTQQELAIKTGYNDRSSISKIEKGLVDIPQTKIAVFAEALKTTESDLMGWQEPKVTTEAEIIADVIGDPELIEYIVKIKEFTPEEREKVFDYIDLIYYKKISKLWEQSNE